jgi:hypothetical protein
MSNGLITDFKFEERFYLGIADPINSLNEQYEWVVIGGAANENSVENSSFPGNWLEITYPDQYVYNDKTYSITFAAVPLEFSPGFGLLTVGGIWVISRFREGKLFT